jgi:hypothetical protein
MGAFVKGGVLGVIAGLPLASFFAAITYGLFGPPSDAPSAGFSLLSIALCVYDPSAGLLAFVLGGTVALAVVKSAAETESVWLNCVIGAGLGAVLASLSTVLLRLRVPWVTDPRALGSGTVQPFGTGWIFGTALLTGLFFGAFAGAWLYEADERPPRLRPAAIHLLFLECLALSFLIYVFLWDLSPVYVPVGG